MVVERWGSCSWSHTGFRAWERENYKVGVASIRYYSVSKCHSNSYTLPNPYQSYQSCFYYSISLSVLIVVTSTIREGVRNN